MNTYKMMTTLAVLSAASVASASVRITEWQYNTTEFIEFTNLGAASIDMTGWSFDDSSRTPGSVSLSAFGALAPGQSAILTEMLAADFRAAFPAMSAAVPVIGENSNNLGRGDEVNLYDAASVLIDRLTYADNGIPANGPRADVNSGNPSTLALAFEDGAGDTLAVNWVLSSAGDAYGSQVSTFGGYGNPGVFALVPEPATLGLLGGLSLLVARRR